MSNLPYINGTPSHENQFRINWIKNGEFLDGDKGSAYPVGSLNRSGYELQENILYLEGKTNELKTSSDGLSNRLTLVETTLGQNGNVDLIDRMIDVEESTRVLGENQTRISTKVDDLTTTSDTLVDNLGERQEGDLTAFDDIFYIKNEIGNYEGFDINSKPVPELSASGMKKKINDVVEQAANNKRQIDNIKQDMLDYDLEEMQSKIHDLTVNVGLNTDEATAFEQLSNLKADIAEFSEDLYSVKEKIGYDNDIAIDIRVNQQFDKLESLEDIINKPETGLVDQIGNLDSNINIIFDDTSELNINVTKLFDIVGTTQEVGLQRLVYELKEQVGYPGDDPNPNSVETRLAKTIRDQQTTSTTLQDIQIQLSEIMDEISAIKSHVGMNILA